VGVSCAVLVVACGTATTGGFGNGGGGSSGSGGTGTGSGSSNGGSPSSSGAPASSNGSSGGSGSNGGSSSSSGGSNGSSGSGSSSGSASSGSGSSGSSGSDSGAPPLIPCSDGGAAGGSSSGGATDTGAACPVTAAGVRVTEIDVGLTYVYQEVDANGGNRIGLALLAISPIPSGGSRLAFMGSDGMVHVAQLDANDQLVQGSIFGRPAFDFQDIYADNSGAVLLVSRDAMGGGTGNCGDPTNLCGTPPNPPDPCWDMYMMRVDTCGNELWATKLTTSSSSDPPYLTSKTDTTLRSFYIWWYAHNGRIAFDGSHYAGYYGAAVSVSQGGCVNIHQGDEMRIVDTSGNLQSGGFTEFGCSHSSFERVIWDGTKFVPVCNNDAPISGKTGQLKFASTGTTIYPVDEASTDFGSVLKAGNGGYWLIVSQLRAGANGLDDVHLVHTTTGMFDQDITLVSDGLNDRAPHLAAFGTNRMIAAWDTSTATGDLASNDANRKLYVQALDATTGAAQGAPFNIAGVVGSRYQDFRTYPDGSVAYAAHGSSGTKIKIVRVTPCH
jgi:hypothetical protein